MSFSYNQIVAKVEELGLDPYYDMDSLPESDRDDILDHLFLACDAADNLDAALFTFMDGSDAARMIVSLAFGNLEEVGKAQKVLQKTLMDTAASYLRTAVRKHYQLEK
tara:strand:+ start:57 stop:380 length:324 start_codon:yes stop_codon:yes gene_type:complete